jgi:hypothetical protein
VREGLGAAASGDASQQQQLMRARSRSLTPLDQGAVLQAADGSEAKVAAAAAGADGDHDHAHAMPFKVSVDTADQHAADGSNGSGGLATNGSASSGGEPSPGASPVSDGDQPQPDHLARASSTPAAFAHTPARKRARSMVHRWCRDACLTPLCCYCCMCRAMATMLTTAATS